MSMTLNNKYNEVMEFPETFEKFAKEYGFKDDKEVYTNGSDLITIFRVKQWLEHDNKLRAIETDTAYECGKHANKWIPCSERLPEEREWYLAVFKEIDTGFQLIPRVADYIGGGENEWRMIDEDALPQEYRDILECIAWMPLPEPYKTESEKENE